MDVVVMGRHGLCWDKNEMRVAFVKVGEVMIEDEMEELISVSAIKPVNRVHSGNLVFSSTPL